MSKVRNELRASVTEVPLFGEVPEPFWAAYREDIARCVESERPTPLQLLRAVLRTEGLWALCTYRLGRWVHTRWSRPGLGALARFALALAWFVYSSLEVWVSLLVDIQLHVTAKIGPGLYVGHFKSVHVGPNVRIGRNCNIGQMSWIAAAGPGFSPGAPVIGDRVYVGVGAKVIGPVTVGDDVAIGANAVVFDAVPEMAVVAGNPARIVSMKGSGDFVSARRDAEPARLSARPAPEKRAQA